MRPGCPEWPLRRVKRSRRRESEPRVVELLESLSLAKVQPAVRMRAWNTLFCAFLGFTRPGYRAKLAAVRHTRKQIGRASEFSGCLDAPATLASHSLASLQGLVEAVKSVRLALPLCRLNRGQANCQRRAPKPQRARAKRRRSSRRARRARVTPPRSLCKRRQRASGRRDDAARPR